MPQNWYRIQNKEKGNAEISIYGEIGESWLGESVTAKDFIKELNTIESKSIDVHINSPGGSVFDGLAIHNALKAHKSEITVKIDGLAASIASVVAMAGDTIEMPENAMMMWHNPSSGVWGTAEDMAKMADILNKIKISLISVYRDKTGLKDEEISELMSRETWFTAQEALDMGFADMVHEPVEMQAIADISNLNFRNIPQHLKNVGNPDKKQRKEKDMTLDEFKKNHTDLHDAIFNAGVAKGIEDHSADTAANVQDAANAEMERIKSVEDQLISGHEDLIEGLKWDGKTTGEQAAMAVLQAEKGLRANMQKQLDDDAVNAVIVDAVMVDVNNSLGFMELVKDHEKEVNCSHGHAIAHMAKTNPSAHAAWISKVNKGE